MAGGSWTLLHICSWMLGASSKSANGVTKLLVTDY